MVGVWVGLGCGTFGLGFMFLSCGYLWSVVGLWLVCGQWLVSGWSDGKGTSQMGEGRGAQGEGEAIIP